MSTLLEERQEEIEEQLMALDDNKLFKVAEKLNIGGMTAKTRKFKLLAAICEYVSTEVGKSPDESESLFTQVQEVLDAVVNEDGDKHKLPTVTNRLSTEDQGQRPDHDFLNRGGGMSTNTDHLAALLQNLATQPAATSLYRRMFKLNGTIGGKDGLSYISICSQVNDAKKTGYSEQEIVIGMKKAISSGSVLRTYFDSQTDLKLKALLSFLRDFFKQKSATELFHDLSKITQHADESATNFLLRAFELRQQVAIATSVEDHKFDNNLIYSTFCRSVRTGLLNDSIRSHMKKYLDPSQSTVGDEILLREINEASSEREEAEQKQKKPKASVNTVSWEDDVLTKAMKPLMDNLATLTKQVENLQAQQQTRDPVGQNRRQNYRSAKCKSCMTDKVERCTHCFKCGSDSHFSRNCRSQSSENDQRLRK